MMSFPFLCIALLGVFHLTSPKAAVFASSANHHPSLRVRPVAMNATPFSSIQPRTKLPVEPDEFDPREINAYYDWRNDMFFREFDLTGSGSVNFMTARRTYKVWLDEFGTPVVLTVGDPVFFWIDLNGNGKFEQELGEMFKDSYEDGVTGNEEPYDNSDLQEPAGPGPQWNPPPQGGLKQPPCDPRFGC
ncbi:hypothetical protein [uncultured Nitrospira sp.]|uniref:hypothetical protein n=1 Tax=uncultured Nitrospira sp. TaxID=157176 RepID=UPI00314040F2